VTALNNQQSVQESAPNSAAAIAPASPTPSTCTAAFGGLVLVPFNVNCQFGNANLTPTWGKGKDDAVPVEPIE